MTQEEDILNATVGTFNFTEYKHPLFRNGAEQASVWGKFAIRDPNQKSDPNYYNTNSMGMNKQPAKTTLGAVASGR